MNKIKVRELEEKLYQARRRLRLYKEGTRELELNICKLRQELNTVKLEESKGSTT